MKQLHISKLFDIAMAIEKKKQKAISKTISMDKKKSKDGPDKELDK